VYVPAKPGTVVPLATWTLTVDRGTVVCVVEVVVVVLEVVVCFGAALACECDRNATKVVPTKSTKIISTIQSDGW
jgi:hypothetical protein